MLLEVDRAYFNALRAQAVERVSQATVDARQLVARSGDGARPEQPEVGPRRQLRDASTCRQAQLLLVQAQNDMQRAFAALAAALGDASLTAYAVTDEPLPPQPPPTAPRSWPRRCGSGPTSSRHG